MSSTPAHTELPLPPRLAEKARQARQRVVSRLPEHTLLSKNLALPLDSTTLIDYSGRLKRPHLDILAHDATSLVQLLGEKRYTAVEVVEAYAISASIAHQSTNCLTWYDLDSAMYQARELDRRLEEEGKVVGPLHGVVISIKMLVEVKGWPQTASHFNFDEYVPDQDASLVRVLRDAGAIFMVKTTQPQSIMQLETHSHVHGRTHNAYNRNCTSGGSSGGEGAIVAMRGSTLGVGTDIGGSIRNPAAFNGLWGFKTSSKRLPRDGTRGGLSGGTSLARIRGAIGPLARSRRDMELFLRVVLGAECWRDDSSLLPLPWRPVPAPAGWSGKDGKLRIGVMWDDGHVRPVKAIRRAMRLVVDRLGKSGQEVELVDVEPRYFAEGWKLITALYYLDGGAKLRDILGDEPMLPLTEWLVGHSKPLAPPEIDQLINQRETLRQTYLTYFRSLSLDAILLPSGPSPAGLHGTTRYWSYTSMFNLLDWPAAVFPTGMHVDSRVDMDDFPEPRNDDEAQLFSTFSAETSVGVPIGLQLVAARYEDERLMAALEVVERIALQPVSAHGT